MRFALCKDFDGAHGGLVKGFLAPARIQSCTPNLLRQTKIASQELDCPVRLHACQEDNEIYLMKKLYGKTSLSWLDEIGFLGERVMIPHATHIQGRHKNMPGADELHLLSDSGTSIVHCPTVEARATAPPWIRSKNIAAPGSISGWAPTPSHPI